MMFVQLHAFIQTQKSRTGLQLPKRVNILAALVLFKPLFRDNARVGLNKQISPSSFDISPGIGKRNGEKSMYLQPLMQSILHPSPFYAMPHKPQGIKSDKLNGKSDGGQISPVKPVAVI